MFIFSAQTVTQMVRRMRYAKEYTSYLKVQGDQIKDQQRQIQQWKSDLLAAKGEKSNLLRQSEQERKKLEAKKEEQQKLLTALQKKQKDVQKQLNQKQKESANLNAQIDKLVEQEIAAAKKREEERRKKEMARREAERKRKEELARKAEKAIVGLKAEEKSESKSTSSKTSKTTASSKTTTTTKSRTTSTSTARVERMDRYRVDDDDRLVSGGFERNKGLMPIPITGPYAIVGHYGVHNVTGQKNVQLDNKGIDIRGQQGAQARAIFQGEVSSIFSYLGMSNVLIRHGSYISVYCNLSSVSVKKGQKVKARDIIGSVARNGDGNYVLHFQLRKETTKLNPEAWVGRR